MTHLDFRFPFSIIYALCDRPYCLSGRDACFILTRMADPDIVKSAPIGEGLDAFRASCNAPEDLSDAVKQLGVSEGLKDLVLNLIWALQSLPAARLLRTSDSRDLRTFLLQFVPLVGSGDFDTASAVALLNKVLNKAPDADIWDAVYSLNTRSTPPPRQLPYLDQTPISFNTSSLANTSEYRKHFDGALKNELGSSLYIDIPGFFDTFFGDVINLNLVAQAVFKRCQEGENPLYNESGWRGWPTAALEKDVLKWFKEAIAAFLGFANESGATPSVERRLLGEPTQHLSGSAFKRKLDIGFCNSKSVQYDWSQILVPGELKSNSNADKQRDTWLDLARYARLVLTVQDTRRFVLGFTLCGSIMRLWEFDRLGGIASLPFDINREGLQFVLVVLGYLWMNEEQLGFDPTIFNMDGKRYMEITRNNKTERLVLVELMRRHSSVAGRATTTWKAYRDGDKSTLVIKDSWQYPEREEEGVLLREATEKGVVNVARYYHHETVRIGGKDDDINDNVRKGLDITKATNAFRHAPATGDEIAMSPLGATESRSRSITRKRSLGSLGAPLPPSKRSRSASVHTDKEHSKVPNRIHRRIVLCDHGNRLYEASSRVAMLAALEGNIIGHESLYDLTDTIQSDISIGNLMMNEEEDNPSWPAFLIDLDLAIKETREQPSGAPNKTGTRAFMAIGALYGEKHSFMHDLESFFWVLFWICIHYDGPNKKSRVVQSFEKWNYIDTDDLARLKKGTIDVELHFTKQITEHFTPYYQPLIPWVNRLRRVVFPNDKPWQREDRELYSQMKEVLEKARSDPAVSADAGNILNHESNSDCLLDLNLAMRMLGKEPPKEPRKMGTRPFMAVGALCGERHSFMQDLESFFWVLFWMCTHYDGPGKKNSVVSRFDWWCGMDMEVVASMKTGIVCDERRFIRSITEEFTPYYQPLIPWVNELRKVVFPDGWRWTREDRKLYSQMKQVLQKAREDPQVW